MNILIIKWGALGDLLAATPAINHIKDTYPSANIIFLTSHVSSLLFPDHSLVDEIIDYKALIKMHGYLGAVKALREKNINIVFNLKWGSELADVFSLFCKADITVGGSVKSYLRFFYNYKPSLKSSYFEVNRHEYQLNLDIVASFINSPKTFPKAYIHISKQDQNAALKFLAQHKISKPFIIISPAASTLQKAWKRDNYIQLCKQIVQESTYKILASFAPEDFEYVNSIVNEIGEGAFLSPPTTLGQIAALVQESSLCICNNSGIMHIAFAVDTPVICFNTSLGWHPFGKNDISLDRIPEEPQDNRMLDNNTVEALLATIPVEEAFEAFKTLK